MEFIPVKNDTDTKSITYVPFPINLLPQSMQDIAIGVQNTIGLKDSSTPAIATLATLSSTIGASCKILIKPGYLQHAHLYTAIIGKSGQAKSGTKEYLLAPLQEKQSEWYDEWERNCENYNSEMREWKSAKKGEKPDYPSEPAPLKRIIVSDITIEAVGKRLKENPLGLLLYNDELETFFGNMGRYNNGNEVPHWLSIHNGQPLTIDRKGDGTIRIPNPSVAIIGGIQPRVLKDRLKENPDYFYSGLLARFLLAMPPVEAILLNDNVIPQSTSWQWEWLLKGILLQRESAYADGKVTPHVFPIDTAAWEVLVTYQHCHAIQAVSGNDSESALHGKFSTNTTRIALVLHVVNQIESGENLSNRMPIPGGTMESACKIVEWFTDESKRIYTLLAEGTESMDKEAESILSKIRQHGGKMTQRELQRTMPGDSPLSQKETLEKKLLELVSTGKWTRHAEVAKNGRAVEHFCIH